MRCYYAVTITILTITLHTGAASQRVRVEKEVVSHLEKTVHLPCSFISEGIRLTQVTWIWEQVDGGREAIVIFHPSFGVAYPDSSLRGRVKFINPSLKNASIVITDVRMADEGKYICEYATYPSGNEQGTTLLITVVTPRSTASTVTVPEGTVPVVVARCESTNGRPPAKINWVTEVRGDTTVDLKPGPDNTHTVISEYSLVPTADDNGKDITCEVLHRTLDKPQRIQMKLAIGFPPKVRIEGYDNNWYVGRTDAMLTCQATGNPMPAVLTWKVPSGLFPHTVQIKENKLVVPKVDDSVNTTFVCEVRNQLGVGKDQVTVVVRDEPNEEQCRTPDQEEVLKTELEKNRLLIENAKLHREVLLLQKEVLTLEKERLLTKRDS
ncbi:hypothetical protein MATL_G00127140 [Megalops atlanticus]|uniref:Ig-like domain-containing protein n=1 Tax=Megalops atlanticus TaxID=7932 RepID=A0A9D3PX12_MEGAT|nr:hypothetical protein MATL_G00127140 [Megalops atlanticus]